MKHYTLLLLAIAGLASSAFAATVIQSPTAVTGGTLGDNVDAPLSTLIDHSGLQTPFTNGTSSFPSYLAGDPQHAWNEGFYTSPGTYQGTIEFDMGAQVFASAFALWFDPLNAVTSFSLFGGLSGDFSDATLLTGAANLAAVANWNDDFSAYTYSASSFTFAPKQVRFLRLEVLGNVPQSDSLSSVTIGEVAVGVEKNDGQRVPDTASTLGLVAATLGGLAAFRRRA
ncbi:hypothetical protein [Nibricoccus sp. IMCC34717]|uniref:hypothetical protein n=1 Tax=Nibricoccus sp. IMCC34717 TaxID=3034021 RepID=UPI00384BEA61